MNMRLIFLAVFFALSVMGCEDDKGSHNHSGDSTGQQLYELHCSECHQNDGKGKFFYGFPDLVELKLDMADIRTQVLGKPGPNRNMPSFSDMPDAEVMLIAEYIISLK